MDTPPAFQHSHCTPAHAHSSSSSGSMAAAGLELDVVDIHNPGGHNFVLGHCELSLNSLFTATFHSAVI